MTSQHTTSQHTPSQHTTTQHTAAGGTGSTTDLQDIAALDRLAGQLAPQRTLRRYARQHATHPAPSAGEQQRDVRRRLLALLHPTTSTRKQN
jgi:hypothetical protein